MPGGVSLAGLSTVDTYPQPLGQSLGTGTNQIFLFPVWFAKGRLLPCAVGPLKENVYPERPQPLLESTPLPCSWAGRRLGQLSGSSVERAVGVLSPSWNEAGVSLNPECSSRVSGVHFSAASATRKFSEVSVFQALGKSC